jgi:beta propeller domain-containing protein
VGPRSVELSMTRLLPTAALVAAAATLALTGCVGDDPPAAPTAREATTTTTSPDSTQTTEARRPAQFSAFGSSRLKFFAECPDLLAYVQDEALQRVTAWGLGAPWNYYGGPVPMMERGATTAAPAVAAADSGASAPPVANEAPTYSGTNTQEVGVDEGDIVETDGTHVFVASQDGVRIVDVAGSQVTAKLDAPDGSHQLLLDGTRLLVTTQPYTGIDTVVSLYDVSDVSSPTLLHRSHLEGRLIAARAIDGTARLVLTSALASRLPFVHPDQFGLDEGRALERNKQIISQSTIDDWMPRSFVEAGDGSFGEISSTLDCSTVAAPSEFAGLGMSWIASIDLRGDGQSIGSAGIISNGDTVYASPTSIYLATVPWDWYQPLDGVAPSQTPPPTLIHKFSLGEGGTASYIASGEVPGQLLNQFSMSEHEGDLRVATTTNNWSGEQAPTSAVRVLRADGDELVQIGVVDGLGKTEQIYAVRFLGTQGYVVTFRQTDPLYVIDLSDPTAPAVTGELKIPGYSAYLHPVGDGLLLGVGQDASDTGRVQGTQLSLFDVHDPANPQRLSTLPIGGYSEAEWDHHAFLYWPEDGTIVLPVSPGWNDCGPAVDCLAGGLTSQFGGVVVAQLQGTELVGRGTISHDARNNNGCWNPLQRSLAIGSELVTIGADQMQFTDRATLVARDSVQWGDAEQYGCYMYVD